MKKTNIQGKKITREQALEGLGDPSTWEEDHKKLYEEMSRKPEHKNCDCGSVKGKFDRKKRTVFW
jgi:hypothetical protein